MSKSLNLKIFLIAIFAIISSIKAEDLEMVRLGQTFGGYLGGMFIFIALKSSECGFDYKANPTGRQ